MYDDTFVSLSRWVRMQPLMLWAWNRFRSCKVCFREEDFKLGIIQFLVREARNSIKCTKCVFCGTALVLSDTLFCVLDVASLIDSKILNSMISRRCRVLTCPCCFFLLIMLFVCFSPGLKKNLPGNYLKIKTQRKQYQNPCFSTSKSHQAASNWVAKSHILFGSDL